MKDEGSLHVQSCSAAGAGLPILAHQIVSFGKQKRQSFAANPLVLFNDSIDFVQRFQWICRTIPLTLFIGFAKLLVVNCRNCRVKVPDVVFSSCG